MSKVNSGCECAMQPTSRPYAAIAALSAFSRRKMNLSAACASSRAHAASGCAVASTRHAA